MIIAMMLISVGLFAQTPPHPNGGGAPGSGNVPVGGGAPIGGGLIIMIALGTAYGLKRVRNCTELSPSGGGKGR